MYKKIYIDKNIEKDKFFEIVKNNLSNSNYNFVADEKNADIILSNRKNEFIKKYNYGKDIIDLGEYVIRHTSGCLSNCIYCYAKRKFIDNKIRLFINYEKLFFEIENLINSSSQIFYFNAGENADSLFFDDLNCLTKILVPYFAKTKNAYLELRTKSNNIKNLFGLNHNRRTIIAFSLNPENIIDKYENNCAKLHERLTSLKLCAEERYPIGIRLDPIFYIDNWKSLYKNLIDKIFLYLKPYEIHSIILGTFRYTKEMAKEINISKTGKELIMNEFVFCKDGKFRYFKGIRIAIYRYLIDIIRKYSKNIPILLSSETKEVWKSCL